jgi:hypothetical protein
VPFRLTRYHAEGSELPREQESVPSTVILHRSEIRKLKTDGSAGLQMVCQDGGEDGSGDGAAGGADRPVLFAIMLALLHRLFKFFLMISKQIMNLAVRFVADSVNLRTKLLPRSYRILTEQSLNPIVLLLKQRPDLLLLFRS